MTKRIDDLEIVEYIAEIKVILSNPSSNQDTVIITDTVGRVIHRFAAGRPHDFKKGESVLVSKRGNEVLSLVRLNKMMKHI